MLSGASDRLHGVRHKGDREVVGQDRSESGSALQSFFDAMLDRQKPFSARDVMRFEHPKASVGEDGSDQGPEMPTREVLVPADNCHLQE